MMSRFRIALLFGYIALAGCDSNQYAGPITYRDHERMARDLAGKPKLQNQIRQSLAKLYGDDLRHMKVPEESGIRENGQYLGNFIRIGEKRDPVVERVPSTGKSIPVEGGYALYRRNCLHCHGVFGAGDGPTSAFLYPHPRDFRPGIFKFTSTNPVNAKPTRADLRKSILYGLQGTSMPGFEALMSASEIEQVIDYMTFLSIRGETERELINEAMNAEDKQAEEALGEAIVKEIVVKVTSSWKDAETQVVNPPNRRVEPTRESVRRGRDLYLNVSKIACVGCHGGSGKGNGSAFIEPEIFRDVALRQWPLDQAIDRYYRVVKDKASVGSRDPSKAGADPDGVGKFLEANPGVVSELRQDRGLMAEVPDPAFAEKLKNDLSTVAAQARLLLPDLVDPEFRTFLVAKMDLWAKSLDEWGNPLRPVNLNEGTYKGGRRPIDLYWRIAKGINGVKMPQHAGPLTEDEIWDVVNFVLALPLDPELLPESLPVLGPGLDKPHVQATSR